MGQASCSGTCACLLEALVFQSMPTRKIVEASSLQAAEVQHWCLPSLASFLLHMHFSFPAVRRRNVMFGQTLSAENVAQRTLIHVLGRWIGSQARGTAFRGRGRITQVRRSCNTSVIVVHPVGWVPPKSVGRGTRRSMVDQGAVAQARSLLGMVPKRQLSDRSGITQHLVSGDN